MSWWSWLLLACAVAYLTKLAGYLVRGPWLRDPRTVRVAGTVTIGLLASLIVVNTVADGTELAIDARLAALGAAGVALWLRAPFLLVVIIGAAAAALVRLAGLG